MQAWFTANIVSPTEQQQELFVGLEECIALIRGMYAPKKIMVRANSACG